MNFLAHALPLLDDAYATAGVGVPDWLGLTKPRIRCRARHAAPLAESGAPWVAALARGVLRHHADDDWFHETPAFGDLSIELARRVRRATGDLDGLRPAFVGHVLLELLLDAVLADKQPGLLDRYYAVLSEVHPQEIAAGVSMMTGADASQLAGIVERFSEMRFLADYADDQRLLFRLNQVMRRVRLDELPTAVLAMLPTARHMVAEHRVALLTPRRRPQAS